MPSILPLPGGERREGVSELSRLKKRAKKLYLQANNFGDMSCGRTLAEEIRPSIYTARVELDAVWKRIQELDPTVPANPLRLPGNGGKGER